MKKSIKRLVLAIIMSVMCICSGTNVLATSFNTSQSLSTGVSSIIVYPHDSTKSVYYSGYPTSIYSYSSRGIAPIANVTLTSSASSKFVSKNCDGYYVKVSFNIKGATRYKLYCNDILKLSKDCANQSGLSFNMVIPYDPTDSTYRLEVFNSAGNSAVVWGHIYLNQSNK